MAGSGTNSVGGEGITELDHSRSLSLAHNGVELQPGSWNGAMPPGGMWMQSFDWPRNVVGSRIGDESWTR